MAFTPITNPEIATGAPIDTMLFGKVKNNFDDHEVRIVAPPNVQTTVLDDYALGANTSITNLDSVVSAFGKAQAQITAIAAVTGSVEPAIPTGTAAQYIKGNKTLGTLSTDVNALQYWSKSPNFYTLTLPSNQLTARYGTGIALLGGGTTSGSTTQIAGWGGNIHSQEVVDTSDGTTTILNRFQFRTAKGGVGAMTGMLNNEIIGDIVAQAHNGVNISSVGVAKIEFKAIENFVGGVQGTAVALYNTKAGTGGLLKSLEIIGVASNTNTSTVRIGGTSSGAGAQGTFGVSSNDMKASLDVNGSMITRTYTYANGSAFDCSKSNSIAVTAPSGSAFVLDNVKDGGAYTLAFQDTTSTITPSFTYTRAENGASTGLTFVYSSALAARTNGKQWVGSLVRVGTFVYVNWQEF